MVVFSQEYDVSSQEHMSKVAAAVTERQGVPLTFYKLLWSKITKLPNECPSENT